MLEIQHQTLEDGRIIIAVVDSKVVTVGGIHTKVYQMIGGNIIEPKGQEQYTCKPADYLRLADLEKRVSALEAFDTQTISTAGHIHVDGHTVSYTVCEPLTIHFEGLWEFRDLYDTLIGKCNRLPFRGNDPETLLIDSLECRTSFDVVTGVEKLDGKLTCRFCKAGWNTVAGMESKGKVTPPKYRPVDIEAVLNIGQTETNSDA
jgi:hypothetical protein